MRNYRGIPIDGKDFVFGWYIKLSSHHLIADETTDWDNAGEPGVIEIEGLIEVIPETVGQQIGQQDKNKKEIYQGDIMEWYNACVTKGQNPICRTVIKWNNLHSRYEGIVRTGKIIGTIHTTPKLMEGK